MYCCRGTPWSAVSIWGGHDLHRLARSMSARPVQSATKPRGQRMWQPPTEAMKAIQGARTVPSLLSYFAEALTRAEIPKQQKPVQSERRVRPPLSERLGPSAVPTAAELRCGVQGLLRLGSQRHALQLLSQLGDEARPSRETYHVLLRHLARSVLKTYTTQTEP